MLALGVCLLCIGGQASAQIAPEALLQTPLGQLKFKLDYQTYYACRREVQGQDRSIDFMNRELTFLIPLMQNDRQELFLTSKAGLLNIHTGAGLPIARRRIPRQLWDFRLGLGYREKLDNDWIWGANFSFGSASDKPFATGDEILIEVLGSLRIPHHQMNGLLILFSFSNARDFLPYVPLPGIAYEYIPNKDLSLIGGFPYSFVRWKATERLTMKGSYMFPRTIYTRISYLMQRNLEALAGFSWFNWRYMRNDRNDTQDRLFFFQKQVFTGLKWNVGDHLVLEAIGGFAFDRFFFEGRDFDDKADRGNIEDGTFVSISLNWRF